jgi:dTDP-4-dehydrorhamnose 3,5-epimerase
MFSQIPTARQIHANSDTLPHEVQLLPIKSHQDARGALCEIFRKNWSLGGPSPVQWNLVQSEANVLRGFHVHQVHWDYLLNISSEMILGLQDLRQSSPSYNLAVSVRLQSDDLHLAVIPPGVAHGFYFSHRATLLYSVSHYFDPGDELACRWDDPAVLIHWPCENPNLSERDLNAGSLADMMTELEGSN